MNHYLLNAVDPVEAVFYKLPIQPLFQTLENEKQQTRALGILYDSLFESLLFFCKKEACDYLCDINIFLIYFS